MYFDGRFHLFSDRCSSLSIDSLPHPTKRDLTWFFGILIFNLVATGYHPPTPNPHIFSVLWALESMGYLFHCRHAWKTCHENAWLSWKLFSHRTRAETTDSRFTYGWWACYFIILVCSRHNGQTFFLLNSTVWWLFAWVTEEKILSISCLVSLFFCIKSQFVSSQKHLFVQLASVEDNNSDALMIFHDSLECNHCLSSNVPVA